MNTQASGKSWNSSRSMLIQALIIIAVFTAYPLFFNKSYDLTMQNETLVMSIDSYSEKIPLNTNSSITLLEEFDPGEMIGGGTTRTLSWGDWRSDLYGDYRLYMYNHTNCWILLRTTDDLTVVLNCDNAETTRNFCDGIKELTGK